MRRSHLPLTALRSFEAAGRLGSFTAAADELRVSQAAISRQVRELEARVGQPLFRRYNRRVELTDAGRALLRVLSDAFDAVAAALDAAVAPTHRTLIRVTADPGFVSAFLLPRLARFSAHHPDVDVLVDADSRLVDLARAPFDLAIRHAQTVDSWPGLTAEVLTECRVSPVLAPSLLQRIGVREPADLLSAPLLHESDRDGWAGWFALFGLRAQGGLAGNLFADSAMTVQAALRGDGVALGDHLFVGEALASGDLLRPFPDSFRCGRYFLVTATDRPTPAMSRA